MLVVCVSVTVFVWTCCHQQAEKKHKNPPYKFIHMLKGISIYPETLSNKKKIIKVRRDKDGPGREGGRGNLLVDALPLHPQRAGKQLPAPRGGPHLP